jgi:uncharacterized small protein (DUF1192 family)
LLDILIIVAYYRYIQNKRDAGDTGEVNMNYRQLQQALKTIRANGTKVNCKLNAKKAILQAEYDRLTAKIETNTAKLTTVSPAPRSFTELFQINVKDELAKADDEILKLFSIEEINKKIINSISSQPTHISQIAETTGFDEIFVYRRVRGLAYKNLIQYTGEDCYFIPEPA